MSDPFKGAIFKVGANDERLWVGVGYSGPAKWIRERADYETEFSLEMYTVRECFEDVLKKFSIDIETGDQKK